MSTMHKFKAFLGFGPMDDYEDDYLEEPGRGRPAPSARYERDFRDGYADGFDDRYDERYVDRFEDDYQRVPEYAYSGSRRSDFEALDRYPARMSAMDGRDARRPELPRLEPLGARGGRPMTQGALAVDSRPDFDRVFEEGSPLAKITTLRPNDYSEARTIGERFRDGSPVIMDLVAMSDADAKRIVDFAAGLAFALRGSFDKVATKVFLLSPADVDVSPEDRKKIAETGFYNQQ